jgi:hypothetical protein
LRALVALVLSMLSAFAVLMESSNRHGTGGMGLNPFEFIALGFAIAGVVFEARHHSAKGIWKVLHYLGLWVCAIWLVFLGALIVMRFWNVIHA